MIHTAKNETVPLERVDDVFPSFDPLENLPECSTDLPFDKLLADASGVFLHGHGPAATIFMAFEFSEMLGASEVQAACWREAQVGILGC